jgi:hypothetical protein
MSEVEYLVDFTVHSVSLGNHREIGSTEQREHDAKLQKYSARYLPSTTAKVAPLSMAKKGTDFLKSLAKHIAHTIALTRGVHRRLTSPRKDQKPSGWSI